MGERAPAEVEAVERLRSMCAALPETQEEEAWVGTRWRIRSKTFAHVVTIVDGWPPAYAEAAGTVGLVEPVTVLTFRAGADEVAAISAMGAPFFKPVWFRDILGITLDDRSDWSEIAELVTESYCHLAPKRLAALVMR